MKNSKSLKQNQVSQTDPHDVVKKPMNNPMGTDLFELDTDKLSTSDDAVIDDLTETNSIDRKNLTDQLHSGLTQIYRHNIDESRIDEVLVEDTLDDKHYPTLRDIADRDAVSHSYEDE